MRTTPSETVPEGAAGAAPWDSRGSCIAFALSVANLNLIPVWRSTVYASDRDLFFVPAQFAHDYAALLTLFAVLGLVAYAALSWVRRAPPSQAIGLVLLLSVVCLLNPLYNLRMILVEKRGAPDGLYENAVVLALIVTLLLIWRFRARAAAAPFLLFVVLSPLAPLNVAHAIWRMGELASSPPLPAPPLSQNSAEPGAPRVVWLIFDEFDARTLWKTPSDYPYPEFEALRESSVTATRMIPPGKKTLEALPSLWLGERVTVARPIRPGELVVGSAGTGESSLSERDHLYRRAYEAGHALGLAGFYHPYCRLFAEYVRHCADFAYATVYTNETQGWFHSLRMHLPALLPTWRRHSTALTTKGVQRAGLRFVSDPELDFVTIHQNVPHPPYLYEPQTERLALWNLRRDYAANILLADRLLGELRRALEESGSWERTFLIVSSDHGSRGLPDYGTRPGAVPFFARAPGSPRGLEIEEELSAVLSHDLILEILAGRLKSNEDIAGWLSGRAHAASGDPGA